jgi:hypothetical protein
MKGKNDEDNFLVNEVYPSKNQNSWVNKKNRNNFVSIFLLFIELN